MKTAEEEALKQGMEAKSKEFVGDGRGGLRESVNQIHYPSI